MLALVLAACEAGDADPTLPPATVPGTRTADALSGPPTPLPESLVAEVDAEYAVITNVYQRSAPAVVSIETVARTRTVRATSRGSGFIYDRNGHIITNAHVIDGADTIFVTFHDGFVTEAEVIGADNFSDIAVIRVDVAPDRLLPLELANSDGVQAGQRVLAIGNPFGLSSSITSGIVSAVGRQLSSAESIDPSLVAGFQNPRIIQVDAEINPGSSGGPLLDTSGAVIGVTTAINTNTGLFQGVGFAVPSNTVGRVTPDLIASGAVDYPWLGVSTIQSQYGVASLVEALELPVEAGVLVTRVTVDSPADDAGLRGGDRFETVRDVEICAGGDIIVAVDDTFVANIDELVYYLLINHIPGDVIDLLVVREGETFEVPVTLGERPTTGSIIPDCGE